MKRFRLTFVLASCLVLISTSGNYAQTPGAAAPSTLWRFLGIPQAVQRMNGNLVNRRGNFPGLESKPRLRSLADPANLEGTSQPTKAAADIKQKEDMAPQTIKAIKYLASVGCGCYNKHGEISEALSAALDDCNESVRFEAAQAIAASAAAGTCANCEQQGCCAPKIVAKLGSLAFEQDGQGCWKEPSARVRRAAVEALRACGPTSTEPLPTPRVDPERVYPPPKPETNSDQASTGRFPPVDWIDKTDAFALRRLPALTSGGESRPDAVVRDVSAARGLVEIACRDPLVLPAKTRLRVDAAITTPAADVLVPNGSAIAETATYPMELEVVASRPGGALARPIGRNGVSLIQVGAPVRFAP